MSGSIDDRVRKQLHEAEGYLELDLPRHSLHILESRTEWPGLQFEACLIEGEALRRLNRFREAIGPLETAASLRPATAASHSPWGGVTSAPIGLHRPSTRSRRRTESSRQSPAAL